MPRCCPSRSNALDFAFLAYWACSTVCDFTIGGVPLACSAQALKW